MKKLSLLIPLLLVLLVSYIHFDDGVVVQTLRLKSFDFMQQTDAPILSDDIAILAIDEEAMSLYGQWPWSRAILADLVWNLREAGAHEIVIPIIMTEEDRLGGDMALAEALAGAQGVIIAQVGSTQIEESLNEVPRGIAKIGEDPLPFLYTWQGMLGPIPLLGLNAAGVGVLNTVPEVDGVVRRLPLFMAIEDQLYPSMAIEVMRVAMNIPSAAIKSSAGGIEKIRVKGFPIITPDANAQIWLRWNKQFKQVSAASSDLSELSGYKVIIGSTTSRIGGVIASPTGPQYNFMPAAVSLQTLLDNEIIQRPYWSKTVELFSTLLLGLLIVLLARYAPYWLVGGSFLSLGGGLIYGSYYAWTNYLYLIDITMALAVLLLVGLPAVFFRFILEFKAKQLIRKQFEHYLDPRQVAILQKNPDMLKLGGERKEMSFLFSDIVGFTPISEYFKNNDDPEGLCELVNDYLDRMTRIINNNGGCVDKYMGDCIMAFWNAPVPCANHAEMAVKSSIEIAVETEKLKAEFKAKGLPAINIGSGINTGDCIVGNMGSKSRFDYSCIGDAVNLAARLEASTRQYDGCTTLYSSYTQAQLPKSMPSKEIDKIRVKGKDELVTVYIPDDVII
jgi:adenylate cyclase